MEAEQLRRILKRIVIISAFFALGLLLYYLTDQWAGPKPGLARLMRGLLIAYTLFVGMVMVLAILMQSGKGGGLAGLGGAGAEGLLGARSASPIAKATYVLGGLLLFLCMLAARMHTHIDMRHEDALGSGAPETTEEFGPILPGDTDFGGASLPLPGLEGEGE